LPGSFYRSPQPGAPPFVEAGDTVGPDTVVAIIETMKLMNPVHAGVGGVVEAILVDNAAPVDGDAVLMTIRPEA
jgi:acetyl-CoA carboxylase biotin carboxyl carrier protein